METLNQTPRWRWEMIEHLKPATIFEWGVSDEYIWAAYRTPTGWIAKHSKDDGKNWDVKKTAVNGTILHPRTALQLIGGELEMLLDYVNS